MTRTLSAALLLVALAPSAFGQATAARPAQPVRILPIQAWEKPIAPGLTYRFVFDPNAPRLIHALRYTLRTSEVRAVPELADDTIYKDNETRGRGTVQQMVQRTQAVAGINGDFFPFTGDPLGLMVRNGELVSHPSQRAVFAWGSDVAVQGVATFRGSLRMPGGTEIPLDGWNQECPDNALVANASVTGFARAKTPNVHVTVTLPENARWLPNGMVEATVESMVTDLPMVPIPEGKAVLTAHGTKIPLLASLRAGDKVSVRLETAGFDWSRITQAIGGGPFLVRGGRVAVDWEAQRFQPTFANNRHPRTALGVTRDGDLWFVVIDGRQRMSIGATLEETARVMLDLGCVEAANLDGGGSSAINVFGLTLNRPSDGRERPVSNGVVFLGPAPAATEAPLAIRAPARMAANAGVSLAVVDADGKELPHREVLWAAQGAAWIDQGGQLRSLGDGTATVFARVRGRTLSAQVVVGTGIAPAPPTPAPTRAAPPPPRRGRG